MGCTLDSEAHNVQSSSASAPEQNTFGIPHSASTGYRARGADLECIFREQLHMKDMLTELKDFFLLHKCYIDTSGTSGTTKNCLSSTCRFNESPPTTPIVREPMLSFTFGSSVFSAARGVAPPLIETSGNVGGVRHLCNRECESNFH